MNHQNFNFQQLVDVAQIVTAIVTIAGVVLSFWFSRSTLLEIQKERVIGQRPFLLFEYGGNRISIEINKLDDGKEYVQPYWPKVGEAGGIMVSSFGKLKNFGSGPAIDIRIAWYIEEIVIKGETFKIDDEKRKQKQYSLKLNENPIMASHLYPNQEGGIHLIPTFISADHDRKIESASGYLIIKYADTYENKHETHQKFYVFTNYVGAKYFHTTFSDLIEKKSHYS